MATFRNRNTNWSYLMMFNIVFIPYHCTSDVLLKFLGIHCSLIKNMTFFSSYETKEYFLPHPWCCRRRVGGGGGGWWFRFERHILTLSVAIWVWMPPLKSQQRLFDCRGYLNLFFPPISFIFLSSYLKFIVFSHCILRFPLPQSIGLGEGGAKGTMAEWRGLECWIQNNVAHFYFQR